MKFEVSTATGKRTINIELPTSPYGVFVSGGIDSSILLCLILKTREVEKNTVPFMCYNVERGFGTEKFSEDMMMWISKFFQHPIPFKHVPLPVGTPHDQCLIAPSQLLFDSKEVSVVFSADTSNPPGFVHAQAPERTPVEQQHSFPRWRLPFLHCDKSHIVQLMYDLDATFIRDVSHTCFATDDYRCGTCFQCAERAWAFETVGQVDHGKY